ncbi:hypothetical protein C6H88_01580 [Chlamydia muridarum str. Nigg]|nr:BPL-N domain-containing protein [Chlamydia muridarum]UFW31931.1 hypothetical protein FTM92_01685 [Chlamydia trachomatis]AID37839.1 hypothetical protein BB17_01630 [Chlamydia muridarum str. Nigg 2 MCR]AIT90507.1 hypothetical protein NC80_01515 [Chlamydia muridarum]AIT91393.1 hypothetical protein NC81_01530 [Chlamydia muridarum]AIW23270.1 hypothetical protein DNC_01530 [Chlamydia muridarum]
MQRILVYSDKGVSPYYLRHTVRWLKQAAFPFQMEVCRVNGQFLIHEPLWEETTQLLVIPGGADVPYHHVLHGLGTARIDNYVREGGAYLGICAGAYFGCAHFSFLEPNGSLLVAKRDLGFFPGMANGPAYDSAFSYTSSSGVLAASLRFTDFPGKSFALFNGGCYFENAEDFSEVRVEARYNDLPGSPAAIISRRLDRGLVVLSGPHIEYLPEFCSLQEENVVHAREQIAKNSAGLEEYKQTLIKRLLSNVVEHVLY